MVHASHPYKAVGNTTVSRTLSFVFLHCPFQIEIIFVNRVVAIASLLLISGVLFPFASILAPRYSKLLTLSISSPSIAILMHLHFKKTRFSAIVVDQSKPNNHFNNYVFFTTLMKINILCFSKPVERTSLYQAHPLSFPCSAYKLYGLSFDLSPLSLQPHSVEGDNSSLIKNCLCKEHMLLEFCAFVHTILSSALIIHVIR